MGLTGALATSARSLDVFSLGIQVASNNISNASTPGYVREELNVSPGLPFRAGPVLVGTGVLATGVRQKIDNFLEARIHAANSNASSASVTTSAYTELQNLLQGLGDTNLGSSLEEFVGKLQQLTSQPESVSQRQAFLAQAGQLTTDIKSLRTQTDSLRGGLDDKLSALVEDANKQINTISSLNTQISLSEANGLASNDAGALRVQRLNAVNRLSEIIPVKIIERPSGTIDVYSGTDYLVLDGHVQNLQTVPDPQNSHGGFNVETNVTRSDVAAQGGEIQGTLEGRDKVLGGFIDQLDQLTSAVISQVNRIHSQGEGTAGFTSVTGTNAVSDPTVALNQAALTPPPQHGSFLVKVRNLTTGQVTTNRIQVTLDGIGTPTTLNSLTAQLGGVANVSASITTDKRLKLDAGTGYEIRFGEDTSGTLAALGINTLFTGKDSSDIAVNQVVANNQALLATGRGGGPSDNTNIAALGSFADTATSQLGGQSVTGFYQQILGTVAQSASAESAISAGYSSFRDTLTTQRQQTSGVSLDEETIRVMNLQRSYQAAARIVTVIDQLFTALLQV